MAGLRTISFICTLTLSALLLVAQQPKVKSKQAPVDDSRKEMQLRMRLNISPHDKEAHKQLVELLRKKNAFRALMEHDGQWLKDNPNDYVTELEMRSWATTLQDPEYAIAIDQMILAKVNRADDTESYDSLGDRLAFLLVDRDRFTEALPMLKHATELAPNDAGVWQNLADAQCKAGQYQASIVSFRKSLDIDNNEETTHQGLADALFHAGDMPGSETEMIASIAIYNAQYHSNETTDSFHQMMKGLVNVSKTDTALAKLHMKLARIYMADGKYDRALTEVDAAAKADDTLPCGYLRAEVYDAAREPAKAEASRRQQVAVVAEMVKKEPKQDFMDEFTYPQEIFMFLPDEEDEGIDAARELILLLGPLVPTGKLKAGDELSLGMAYCTEGRTNECRQQFEEAFQKEPKFRTSKTEYSLAKALTKQHDLTDAATHYQSAYELEPQNVTYRMDYEAARKN